MSRFVSRTARTPRPPSQLVDNLFQFILFALFMAYWLYMNALEQTNPYPFLERWLPGVVVPSQFAFVIGLFFPRVLRHLIPLIAGWQMARGAALHMMQTLYDLPDTDIARRYLENKKSGRKGTARFISSQTVEADRAVSALLRVGGPGWVAVGIGDVAVTELHGRFKRILPPGKHHLEYLEYVHTILDLRQQRRTISDIPLFTQDDIQMIADITLIFRVATDGQEPRKSNPYPYADYAVELAAYAETAQPDGSVTGWDAIPANTAKRTLDGILSRYTLNDLMYPSSATPEPFTAVATELQRLVGNALAGSGIELTGITINRLTPKETAVLDQYIAYWKASGEAQIELEKAESKALLAEEIKAAHAEAEVNMIQAIINGIERAKQAGNAANMQDVVALRLVEALESMAEQADEDYPVPRRLYSDLTALYPPSAIGQKGAAAPLLPSNND